MSRIDEARPPREGEELDAARLEAWLRQVDEVPEGELEVAQFPGGHSNLTYLLTVGGKEWVLRRGPRGAKIRTAHDMGREWRILSRLHSVYPKAPRAIAHCEDPEVIGAPFYVMERVRGLILRGQRLPEGLALDADTMRRMSEAVVDNLVDLHAVDVSAAGLSELGRPEGYAARQVSGWTERYRAARTDDLPDMERAAAWLAEHLPPPGGAALIHNDYKYDNLVLDPDDVARIRAVLDWEMATFADPLMDLGTTLSYWIDPDDPEPMRMVPAGPTTAPGNLSRREVVERYAQRSGRDPGDMLFHYVYGLFKVAVIAQQIYKRFKEGHTRDERFATLIFGVALLGQQACRAIDRGRIYDLGD